MSNGQGAAERDKWTLGTAPVGQFPANPFGLFDILGNASEWVADCAEPGREDAGSCEARLVRGGNWTSDAAQLQVTVRAGKPRTFRANYIGFRLASGS
jgi:formylglycine-generating enzyme required for sulfatase activity